MWLRVGAMQLGDAEAAVDFSAIDLNMWFSCREREQLTYSFRLRAVATNRYYRRRSGFCRLISQTLRFSFRTLDRFKTARYRIPVAVAWLKGSLGRNGNRQSRLKREFDDSGWRQRVFIQAYTALEG
jgi:hypothetical protein